MKSATVEGLLSVAGVVLFVAGLGLMFRGGWMAGLLAIVGAFAVWQVSYRFRP